MKYSLLDVAFSGLMHDIGKFYQRIKNLTIHFLLEKLHVFV